MSKKPSKAKIAKTLTPSLVVDIEHLSRPIVKDFAKSIQESLSVTILQAVTRFFDLSTPTTSAPPQVHHVDKDFHRLGACPNAGWFNFKKLGNTIEGELKGMYWRKDELNPKGQSPFFQVQLSSPCEVRLGRGEDAAIVQAKAGDIVNLNYGPKTKDLEELIPQIMNGGVFQIYGTIAGAEIKLPGNRKMYNFEVFTKMTVAPKVEDEHPSFVDFH